MSKSQHQHLSTHIGISCPLLAFLALALFSTPAATRYVNLNNSTAAAPYTSWETAATNIQHAVDAAVAGDQILVTNGTYSSGGRVVYGSTSNRVVLDKAVALQSVNGPQFTTIQGYKTTNSWYGTGDQAVRCVYLGAGASLSGFALIDGATRNSGDLERERSGGGLWSVTSSIIISNCVIIGNVADAQGGGVYRGTLLNCTIRSNLTIKPFQQTRGGGVYACTLTNCVLSGNVAAGSGVSNFSGKGGGAYDSTLHGCTLENNSAGGQESSGGGASSGLLVNCLLTGNLAGSGGGVEGAALVNYVLKTNSASTGGGGASGGFLNDCTLSGNTSSLHGGGVERATLIRCNLSGNSADEGGGAWDSILTSCVLTGNSATARGGGATSGRLYNCLITGNSAGEGGGIGSSYLYNCTITGNTATQSAGGVYSAELHNSIIYYNNAPEWADCKQYSTILSFCCTPGGQVPVSPQFVNLAGGDLRLQSNSPCINSGYNANAPANPDLDGNTRIAGGTVDIGAYEFQSPSSTISFAWLQQHGFPLDGSADYTDPDGDGMNNREEWIADTLPHNNASALRLGIASDGSGIVLVWPSVTTRAYFIERSTNVGNPASFSPVMTYITNPWSDTIVLGDLDPPGPGAFYRVGVHW